MRRHRHGALVRIFVAAERRLGMAIAPPLPAPARNTRLQAQGAGRLDHGLVRHGILGPWTRHQNWKRRIAHQSFDRGAAEPLLGVNPTVGAQNDEIRVHLGRKLDEFAHRLTPTDVNTDRDAKQAFRGRGLLVDIEAQVVSQLSCALLRGRSVEHMEQVEAAARHPRDDARRLVERRPVRVREIQADYGAERLAAHNLIAGLARTDELELELVWSCLVRMQYAIRSRAMRGGSRGDRPLGYSRARGSRRAVCVESTVVAPGPDSSSAETFNRCRGFESFSPAQYTGRP